MSAREGDNVTARSTRMPWHQGPTLLEHLETVPVDAGREGAAPFRLPVQYVSRPDSSFRGFAGTIASGRVATGDPVAVAKSGRTTRVARIATFDGDLAEAREGQAVTLVLEDEVDVSRGDMLAAPGHRPHLADQFAAQVIWFDEQALLPGRAYLLLQKLQVPKVGVGRVYAAHGVGGQRRLRLSRQQGSA